MDDNVFVQFYYQIFYLHQAPKHKYRVQSQLQKSPDDATSSQTVLNIPKI